MEKPKLKKCPWCGSDKVSIVPYDLGVMIWCNNEFCTRDKIVTYSTIEEAIAAWDKEAGGNGIP